jgi:Flp pilus assembly protein TadG
MVKRAMPRRTLLAFANDAGGAVALIFALVLVVLGGFAGAALDYSRAAAARTRLQAALDAIALTSVKASEGKSVSAIQAEALRLLTASTDGRELIGLSVNVAKEAGRLSFTAGGALKTTLASLLGVQTIELSASAEVAWGTTKLEVALVLDNTGSMSSSGKMTALKKAVQDFLDTMQANATSADSIKVAIVPFTTSVRVPNALRNAAWIDPEHIKSANWPGCVWDRDHPYDVSDAAPEDGKASTLFPTELKPEEDKKKKAEVTCSVSTPFVPLTNNFAELSKTVTAMTPNGYTNTTVGLAWGLHMLTPSEPITNAVPLGTPGVKKYIVFMTDGLNTRNRWTHSQAAIDARTSNVCNTIRDAGIEVYTIRVIEGNATLLRSCATTPSMYYEVKNASEIGAVFTAIGKELTQLRISG